MAKLVRGYRNGEFKNREGHFCDEISCTKCLESSINVSLHEPVLCDNDIILKLRILRNAVSILGPSHPLTALAAKSLADDAERLAAKQSIAA